MRVAHLWIVIVLLSCYLAPIFADECSSIAQVWNTFDQVISCFKTIRYNRNAQTVLYNTLQELFDTYYVFKPSLISPPAPYDDPASSIDLNQALDAFNSMSFATDFDMHMDVSRLVIRAHDGHFNYNSPCYNRLFLFVQPFSIILGVDDDFTYRYRILINSGFDGIGFTDFYKSVAGFDPSIYHGAQVMYIDGNDPMTAVGNYLNDSMNSGRDSFNRMNTLMARTTLTREGYTFNPGLWGATFLPPAEQGRNYAVRLPGQGEITRLFVPWVALNMYRSAWNNNADFWDNACPALKWDGDNGPSNTNDETLMRSVDSVHKMFSDPSVLGPNNTTPVNGVTFAPNDNAERTQLNSVSKPVYPAPYAYDTLQYTMFNQTAFASGGPFQFYQINDATATLKIVDFIVDQDFDASLQALESGIQQFHDRGLTNLIMDLSDNDGGSVCFAYQIVDYFFPGQATQLTLNMRCTSAYYNGCIGAENTGNKNLTWHPSQFLDPATGQPMSDCEFLNPEKGTSTDPDQCFTQRFLFNCGSTQPLINTPANIPKSNIRIVSNGVCYSMCAIFAYVAKELGVYTYNYGGYAKFPNSIASSFGGCMYNFASLSDSLRKGVEANYPQKFASLFDRFLQFSTQMTLSVAEAFGYDDSGVPLELQRISGDKPIFQEYKYVYDQYVMWERIAGDF